MWFYHLNTQLLPSPWEGKREHKEAGGGFSLTWLHRFCSQTTQLQGAWRSGKIHNYLVAIKYLSTMVITLQSWDTLYLLSNSWIPVLRVCAPSSLWNHHQRWQRDKECCVPHQQCDTAVFIWIQGSFSLFSGCPRSAPWNRHLCCAKRRGTRGITLSFWWPPCLRWTRGITLSFWWEPCFSKGK